LTAPTTASSTTLAVSASVIQDVTIAVGSSIQLVDDGTLSPVLVITGVDPGQSQITVDTQVGDIFPVGTTVKRMPHAVRRWTDSPTVLTQCPEDSTHPVQAGSGIIIEIKSPVAAKVIQSDLNQTHIEAHGKRLTVTPNMSGVVEFSWPFAITVRGIVGVFEGSNTGDTVDIESGPDTPAGLLTEGVAAGATVLTVDGTVLAVARASLYCRITQNGTTDTLGRIVSVNGDSGQITVETPTVNAFTAGAIILVTNAHTLGLPVPKTSSNGTFTMGNLQIIGRTLPATVKIRITYHNVGPDVSSVVVIIKILT
jgi:hypothetical protein